MNQEHYKENRGYKNQLTKDYKISARKRNVSDRIKILKKNGIASPADLLEIGSHEGLFLKTAKEAGFRVLGIEPNVYAVNFAKDNNLEVIGGTFEEAFGKVDGRKFDVVVMFHTLEHMPDYFGNLKKVRTIIKPNGFLVIEVPNNKSYRSKKYGGDWVYIYDEHLHHFSPQSLSDDLGKTGFVVKRIYFRDFDEMKLSIKHSLDRLLPFKFKKTNIKRQTEEQLAPDDSPFLSPKLKMASSLLVPIRFLLAVLVKILKRGDFMLIVVNTK